MRISKDNRIELGKIEPKKQEDILEEIVWTDDLVGASHEPETEHELGTKAESEEKDHHKVGR